MAAPALGVVVYVVRLEVVAVAWLVWLVWFLNGVQLLGLGARLAIAKGRPRGRPCLWVWVYVVRLQLVAVAWLVWLLGCSAWRLGVIGRQ